MAYNLSDFPISTEEPRIEVNLPVGTHILELVVEDSAGLKSLPDTVVITVEPEVIPAATIESIEPVSALRGSTFNLTIRGTGLAEATGVVFYTLVTPTRPSRPTLPTLSISSVITRPSTISAAAIDETELLIRPIKVADSSITAVITERAADGITARVSIDSASTTGSRVIGVITPNGTVQSGTLAFSVTALPTLTIPTLTIPTLTVPTLTIPTLTIPTLTVPTLTVPTLTVPTITRPTLTVPTLTVPTLTVPTLTVPTLTVPTITRPTLTVPTLTVPTLTVPTLTVPTLTRPTLTVPTLTVPTLTRPTLTVPTITSPTLRVPTIPVSNPTLTLVDVRGIGAATEDRLRASGITSVDMLASANAKDVADALGYQDITRAQALIDEAAKLLGS